MLEFTMLRITNASMHVCTPERNHSTHQGRIQDLPKGEDHVERGAPAYSGVWGLSSQRGSGAEALVGVMGRSPLKLKVKAFCPFLPRDALVHSAVLRLHVVRPSVRL